jgi:hypothetical protein
MSTQLLGFSIGGVAHRFLVAPPSMSMLLAFHLLTLGIQTVRMSVWPNTLVYCALFNTLHSQTYAGIGPHNGPTREQYFLYAFIAATVWCRCFFLSLISAELIENHFSNFLLGIVPGYLFQAVR